jgi:hypothetical protein
VIKFLADNARLEVDDAIEIYRLHTRHETQTMCLEFFLQFQKSPGMLDQLASSSAMPTLLQLTNSNRIGRLIGNLEDIPPLTSSVDSFLPRSWRFLIKKLMVVE